MHPPDPSLSTGAAMYCCELARAGWIQIGEGVGGRVFHREGDPEVIKVMDGDNCYLAFADYVCANPRYCLPKLTIAHRSGQWAVFLIEHLEPLSDGNVVLVADCWTALLIAWKANSVLPPPKDWSDVAHALRTIALNGGCDFDMKQGNAMQRGTTIVFTDPLN